MRTDMIVPVGGEAGRWTRTAPVSRRLGVITCRRAKIAGGCACRHHRARSPRQPSALILLAPRSRRPSVGADETVLEPPDPLASPWLLWPLFQLHFHQWRRPPRAGVLMRGRTPSAPPQNRVRNLMRLALTETPAVTRRNTVYAPPPRRRRRVNICTRLHPAGASGSTFARQWLPGAHRATQVPPECHLIRARASAPRPPRAMHHLTCDALLVIPPAVIRTPHAIGVIRPSD